MTYLLLIWWCADAGNVLNGNGKPRLCQPVEIVRNIADCPRIASDITRNTPFRAYCVEI